MMVRAINHHCGWQVDFMIANLLDYPFFCIGTRSSWIRDALPKVVFVSIFEQSWIGCSSPRPCALHLCRVSSFKSSSELQGDTTLPHSWVALPSLVRQSFPLCPLGIMLADICPGILFEQPRQ